VPVLLVEKGKDKGKSTVLLADGGALLVGRERGANLQVNDSMCSRKHFRVSASGPGEYSVEDLGSSNGTLLNGKKIKGVEKIEVGDKIQAGDTIISFLDSESSDSVGTLTGQNIAGYLIEERIGRGGMGTVYKALQVSLDRPVALKILAKELISDKNFINLFIKEARSAGQLNHPNIVQVYDVGNVGDTYFFSMEFVGGGSVEEILNKRGSLTSGQAIPIIIDAAKGLEYAEKKAIVHRDIKPDNLMISDDHVVKIGDLGIAKSIKSEGTTQEDGISGSPHYISPEQAQGQSVDHRADIYSLGCTFFQILTGRTPYSGKSPKEIIIKHINEPAPNAQDVNPEIPAVVSNVIRKMMDKDPANRFQTATDLINELKQLQKKYPPESLSAKPQKAKFQQKQKKTGKLTLIGVAAGAAVVLALVLFFVFRMGGGPDKELVERFKKDYEAFLNADAAKDYAAAQELGGKIINEREYKIDEFESRIQTVEEKLKAVSADIAAQNKAAREGAAKDALDAIMSAAGNNPDIPKMEKMVEDLERFVERRDLLGTAVLKSAKPLLDEFKAKLLTMKIEKNRRDEELKKKTSEFEEKKRSYQSYFKEGNRFGEAIRAMREFSDKCSLPEVKTLVDDYIRGVIMKDAAEAFDSAVADAKNACRSGMYEEARRIIRQHAEQFDVPEITERSKTELAAIDSDANEKMKKEHEEFLKIDEAEYARTMEAARPKIRELDLVTAKGKFTSARYMCKTDEFKARMDDEAAAVDKISDSFQKIINALNGASKNRIEFALKINKGKIITADSTGITIRNNADGSNPKFFWKDVSPEEFLRIGRECDLNAEGRLGLGLFARFLEMDSDADKEFDAALKDNPALEAEIKKFKK
jgi:hypothetical protein